MKQLIVLLTMLLVFPVAFAGNGDDYCRNINAHATLVGEGSACDAKPRHGQHRHRGAAARLGRKHQQGTATA